MVNITLSVDEDTHKKMKRLKEINFSEVARKAIKNFISEQFMPAVSEEKIKGFFKYAQKIGKGIKFKDNESEYGHSPSWLLNVGIRALRLKNFEEAAYCFDGVRCGTVKYIVDKTSLQSTLNKSLITLREYCTAMRGGASYKVERFFRSSSKKWLFYKNNLQYFPDDPSEKKYLRFDDRKFLLNALCFTTGFMLANVRLIPSRAEVDPFGTETTLNNIRWVILVSKKLIEAPIDKESDDLCLKAVEL